MTDPAPGTSTFHGDRRTAAALMRMALLDRAGEGTAAARLRHAIDTLERRQPRPPTQAEIDAFLDGRSAIP